MQLLAFPDLLHCFLARDSMCQTYGIQCVKTHKYNFVCVGTKAWKYRFQAYILHMLKGALGNALKFPFIYHTNEIFNLHSKILQKVKKNIIKYFFLSMRNVRIRLFGIHVTKWLLFKACLF